MRKLFCRKRVASVELTHSLKAGMVVIESKRDQPVFDWLVEQVGNEGVAEAFSGLAAARRANPSTVAKMLGVKPPPQLAVAAKADAKAHLEEIARLPEVRSCT